MRKQFSGYFTPSDEEFTQLWSECTFAFDANVLLGLYRSTSETQEIFFSVLEKIADRIFLPHQAASEYLRNRLNAISFRMEQYGKIKAESDRLAKTVESTVQEHAVLRGEDISKAAKEFVEKIAALAEVAASEEPDLLHSDTLLARLADLFENSTGGPYKEERLREIYALGSRRYAQSIPPGYKDDKKGEPGKYGDLIIWFQLMDFAKANHKNIIFVTGDAKEDWIQQHKGESLGPRPELRQEMAETAETSVWIYTTPRFLEFARQFLALKFDTKKAESEFEKIEKQDKQAAEAGVTMSYRIGSDYLQAQQVWPDWTTYMSTTHPTGFSFDNESDAYLEAFANTRPNQRFLSLLPINGAIYNSPTGKWTCEITATPNPDAGERSCYALKFNPEDSAKPWRNLKLWVSVPLLERDVDWGYKKAIWTAISRWMATNQQSGEIELMP